MGADALLPQVDLWADVPFDHLPAPLVQAFDRQDWPVVKAELRQIMDGVVTDGAYGRELLNLVLRLPIGSDPVFDRYRAMVSIDFGDWDGLNRCLEAQPIDRTEIVGLRDLLLAPLSQVALPSFEAPHHERLFQLIHFQLSQTLPGHRHWIARLQDFRPVELWTRRDVPTKRHIRYRQLHDTLVMGLAEAHGGRLPVAIAFAMEATRVGEEGEPLRFVAMDLEKLAASAIGDLPPTQLATWEMIPRSRGPSPLASWQLMSYVFPLAIAARLPSLEWAADVAEHAAVGLGSPRALFQAQTWKIAARMALGTDASPRGLPGLLVQARHAIRGLRVFPLLLGAISAQRAEAFREVASVARTVGNVWVQVAALTWIAALGPTQREAEHLRRLLEVTGWRRPALVPATIASEAALGLVSHGLRGRSIVELAAVAARPTVTFEVLRQHLDGPVVSVDDQLHAVDALAALGTDKAKDLLKRLAVRRDALGERAATLVVRPTDPDGLSDREIEVLGLAAEGLTDREIAFRLTLSPHTVSRHVANARAKLGASNRAGAVARIAQRRASAR